MIIMDEQVKSPGRVQWNMSSFYQFCFCLVVKFFESTNLQNGNTPLLSWAVPEKNKKYHMDRVTLDFSQENKEINSPWVGRKVKLDSLFLNLIGHESPID